ncbi:DUF1425 domain-containing protein [Ectothiorhodospiraceae bacterium BW-2]|nr:DUF1425 domain-containing protein [Ectothiorhodospiraceae bacterium BW-2]
MAVARGRGWLGVWIGLVAIVGGCATAGIEQRGGREGEDQLFVYNQPLADRIDLTAARWRQQGELLQVEVTVVNQSQFTESLQYRWQWFDSEQFVIEGEKPSWIPLTLYGRSSQALRAVAPSATATQYQLYLRER